MENFLLNINNTFKDESPKIPFLLRKAIKMFFSDIGVKNNQTLRFESIEFNGHFEDDIINKTKEKLLVKNRLGLLSKSSLIIDNNSITYSFGWNLLMKKPTSIINSKLAKYMFMVLGKHLNYIIPALPKITEIEGTLLVMFILDIMKNNKIHTYIENDEFPNFKIICDYTNSLFLENGYFNITINIINKILIVP